MAFNEGLPEEGLNYVQTRLLYLMSQVSLGGTG
ncbi:unknown [Bacteroides sp. CAG:1076]|jgi:hypothetical protein|nr:unknown [Bacteroides sp. CAG:1076]